MRIEDNKALGVLDETLLCYELKHKEIFSLTGAFFQTFVAKSVEDIRVIHHFELASVVYLGWRTVRDTLSCCVEVLATLK